METGIREEADVEGADQLLTSRLVDGDEAVLDEILAAYWTPIVRYAAAYVECHDTAQDIAQECFARLWRHRSQWIAGRSVRPFLFRVAHNLACNERRNSRVRSRLAHSEGVVAQRTYPSVAQIYDAKALDSEAVRAIGALPERRRQVFVLARLEGLSYREIADVLEISVQTVANQMSAALADLRRELAPYLSDAADTSRPRARLQRG
jgi:RNA polymerase sigma-70 factor (ECF subfamily)